MGHALNGNGRQIQEQSAVSLYGNSIMGPPSSPTVISVSVNALLRFFDEKPGWSQGHATSIVGVVGEDLSAACFKRYLESRGHNAAVLVHPGSDRPWPVTTGKQRGPRLDRWIQVDWQCGSRTIFQTEIKSWSAHAIGGQPLPVCATPEEVTRYKQARWERRWDGRTIKPISAAKVLARMKPPDGVDEMDVRPLLIFWEPLGPHEHSDKHLFKVALPEMSTASDEFQELWVFSVSSYLRSISASRIELNMPDAARRLRMLSCLFSTST